MRRRTEKRGRKQVGQVGKEGVGQLLLPMLRGMIATKEHLLDWVREAGFFALDEILRMDAEGVAGTRGKHRPERTHYHWGRARTELPFGGRRIHIDRPRVRTKEGEEALLPALEHFKAVDPLPERVMNQILLGVSTRGYECSLDPVPGELGSRGTSKASVSRALVSRSRKTMEEQLAKRLDDVTLVALYLDGIQVDEHNVIVALGLDHTGKKIPLGLWLGSTENAIVCTELLQNLLERGLKLESRLLCVIDGGKGLRKAIQDVLGDLALVQRCQIHKLRNVRAHLPKKRQAYVLSTMRDAYTLTSVDKARKKLKGLVSWLGSNGHSDAASSLNEGLEETLTVIKLGLPPLLRRTLATTNPIESLLSSVRRVTRNVKRWRDGNMVKRWVTLGVFNAEKQFRKIKGCREIPILIAALKQNELDLVEKVA